MGANEASSSHNEGPQTHLIFGTLTLAAWSKNEMCARALDAGRTCLMSAHLRGGLPEVCHWVCHWSATGLPEDCRCIYLLLATQLWRRSLTGWLPARGDTRQRGLDVTGGEALLQEATFATELPFAPRSHACLWRHPPSVLIWAELALFLPAGTSSVRAGLGRTCLVPVR